jgi:hypothetical protein
MKKVIFIFILVILSFSQFVSAQSNSTLNLRFEVYNANTKQPIKSSEGVTAEVKAVKFYFDPDRSSMAPDNRYFNINTFNDTRYYKVDAVLNILIRRPITFTVNFSGPGYEPFCISDTFCVTHKGELFLGDNFKGYASSENPTRAELALILSDRAILCDCKYNNILYPIYLKPKELASDDNSDTKN